MDEPASAGAPGTAKTIIYTSCLLLINLLYYGASLVVSHVTHSLTLQMDANYVLFVSGSLIVSLIDLKLRNAQTVKHTFGWARIEFLGNLFISTFLASLSFSATVESIQLLIHLAGRTYEHGVHQPLTVIIFGIVRTVLGVVTFGVRYAIRDSCRRFRVAYTQTAGIELRVEDPDISANDDEPHTYKKRPKLQHSPLVLPNLFAAFVRESVGPVAIILCGLVNYFYSVEQHEDNVWVYFIDPSLCLLQVTVLGCTMFYNARESGLALMLMIPQYVDIGALQKKLLDKFPEVQAVHDFHLWRSSRHQLVVTCHVVCPTLLDFVRIKGDVDRFFREEGIHEITIQPEIEASPDNSLTGSNGALNACTCCDASPNCCSLKHQVLLDSGVRKRAIGDPNPEMLELEIGDENGELEDSAGQENPV